MAQSLVGYYSARDDMFENTDLDLDEFLDSVDDDNMLVAFRTQADHGFVTCTQPSVLEGFFVGRLVLEVAENDAWATNDEFSGCVVSGYFISFWGDNSCFDPRNKASGCSIKDVAYVSCANDSG